MCWRTYFLRRMESQAKGTHYNICACARKETTEGWKKTRRYGRVLYDIRVLTCLTSGSRHVRHPGLGMHDTRVSDTRKRLTGLTAQEENNTDTYKEKKYRKKTAEKKIQKNNGTAKKNRHIKKEKGGWQPGKHEASHNPTNLLKEDARCIKC